MIITKTTKTIKQFVLLFESILEDSILTTEKCIEELFLNFLSLSQERLKPIKVNYLYPIVKDLVRDLDDLVNLLPTPLSIAKRIFAFKQDLNALSLVLV